MATPLEQMLRWCRAQLRYESAPSVEALVTKCVSAAAGLTAMLAARAATTLAIHAAKRAVAAAQLFQ